MGYSLGVSSIVKEEEGGKTSAESKSDSVLNRYVVIAGYR
jgi:hypothetical protein